jgi:hypothetical protein
VDLLNSFQVGEPAKIDIGILEVEKWRKTKTVYSQYIQGWRIEKLQADALLLQQMPPMFVAV